MSFTDVGKVEEVSIFLFPLSFFQATGTEFFSNGCRECIIATITFPFSNLMFRIWFAVFRSLLWSMPETFAAIKGAILCFHLPATSLAFIPIVHPDSPIL